MATFLLVLLGVIAAFAAGFVIDKNFFTLLLSYCPGGIYEVAVIAIYFDLDPEFVSFHHIIRLLMILFIVPIILKLINKKESSMPTIDMTNIKAQDEFINDAISSPG